MLYLGVGCSLLYVAAASKNELNKMKDLLVEMELTLQKMSAVMQRKIPFVSHPTQKMVVLPVAFKNAYVSMLHNVKFLIL